VYCNYRVISTPFEQLSHVNWGQFAQVRFLVCSSSCVTFFCFWVVLFCEFFSLLSFILSTSAVDYLEKPFSEMTRLCIEWEMKFLHVLTYLQMNEVWKSASFLPQALSFMITKIQCCFFNYRDSCLCVFIACFLIVAFCAYKLVNLVA